MVLWTIVAMTLVAAVVAQWVSNGVEHARARQAASEAEIDMLSAQSIVLFTVSTQYFSMRGMEVNNIDANRPAMPDPFSQLPPSQRFIRIDDAPYLLGQTLVRIQDTRGLINLNLAQDDEIFRLLGVFEVPVEARGPLLAKLRDYTDPGALSRLNGAKAPQYAAVGKPLPRLSPLLTPWEAKRVLDWDKFPGLWQDEGGISSVTTTSRELGLNLNTAPAAVLSLVEGMNPTAVEKILAARQITPTTSTGDVSLLGGVSIPDNPLRYIFFPSDVLRVRYSTKNAPRERVVVIQLTPQQLNGPWRIDYTVETLPLSSHANDASQTINFPIPSVASVGK
jgi:hypothetical protein